MLQWQLQDGPVGHDPWQITVPLLALPSDNCVIKLSTVSLWNCFTVYWH